MQTKKLAIKSLVFLLFIPSALLANTPYSAEELARRAQDPLSDIKAIMTSNTIAFGAGDEKPAYNFQIQPVFSMPSENGDSYILRLTIPVTGLPGNADFPKLGPELTPPSNHINWGISDSLLQMLWSPASKDDFQWGAGVQASLRTHTSEHVEGPGWGGGLVAAFFEFNGNISYGTVINHLWGEDKFSLTTIEPSLFYNIAAMPGYYIGYSNSTTYSWNAESGQRWQVPLGLTAGRTFPIGNNGYAIDINLGGYSLIVRPDNGADWQLKFGLSLFLP